MTDKIEIFDCIHCGRNVREHRDPFTQSFIAAGVNTGKTTPCGKQVWQYVHFGCAQQTMRD